MTDAVRILVVDDHPLFRQGVVHSLELDTGFEVVGETDSGERALEMARALLPDLVLLDVSMPGWNGIVTAERIAIACPATVIVMLTMSDDKDKLLAAFKAGARGYVLKGAGPAEILRAVHAVGSGEAIFGAALARRVLDLFAGGSRSPSSPPASGRSWNSSPTGSPTARSPHGCI